MITAHPLGITMDASSEILVSFVASHIAFVAARQNNSGVNISKQARGRKVFDEGGLFTT